MTVLRAKLLARRPGELCIFYHRANGEVGTASALDDSADTLDAIEKLSEPDRVKLAQKVEAIHATARTRH